MTKCKLEYIWLDGYQPTQSLRAKTKIVEDFSGKVEDAPVWAFDGSSTEQAPGGIVGLFAQAGLCLSRSRSPRRPVSW